MNTFTLGRARCCLTPNIMVNLMEPASTTYSVRGPLPGIGGPFDSAAEFFEAWANQAKFPYHEGMIRERTPADVVDEILRSIQNFPLRLKDFQSSSAFAKAHTHSSTPTFTIAT